MRAVFAGIVTMLICAAAPPADAQVAVYDPDPEHLWNRLYSATAVRMEEGQAYGVDISEPYRDRFDDTTRLIAVLDEFLENKGEERASGDLKRAMFLNDMWTAFDIAAHGAGEELQRRLASTVSRLRMSSAAIARLPDNYAQAVKTGGFAREFDPDHPERPFLPADLFDPKGPWVQVGKEGRGVVAPFHVGLLSGRSTFLVFIRCPGGRQATLAYLDRLNFHATPWQVRPAPVGVSEPGGERERWDSLTLDAQTPQLPAGTMVALVRQMLVIDETLKPVATPVTQKVQFRVYRKVGGRFQDSQSVFEYVMRRRAVLSDASGGLHVVAPDEREHQLTHHDGADAQRGRAPVVLSTCAACHSSDGIFSINAYTRLLSDRTSNPQLLPASNVDYQGHATADWKQLQFNWGLLIGLIQGQER